MGRKKKSRRQSVGTPTEASEKKKGKNLESSFLNELSLHPETKKSIWGIAFLGLAIVLFLANFKNAGPAGDFIYKFFSALLGVWGYFLLPLIFLTLGVVFLSSERKKIYGAAFLGAVLFVFSGLGFIDIVFDENKAGLLGKAVGSIQNLFGFTASLVIVGILLIISFLVTLNLPIKIKRREKIIEEDKYIDDEEEIRGDSPEISDLRDIDFNGTKEKAYDQQPMVNDTEKTGEPEDGDIKSKIAGVIPEVIKPRKNNLMKKVGNYIFPTIDLLKSSVEKPTSGDLRANANIIKRTLESFGILVEMGEINIGPKVTRYTLKPAEGIKLSRIMALSQDLALALAAHPIRIEAPIPGKSLVGIEVPNKAAAVVRLGSLINYPEFVSSGNLSFALGRDVTGEPTFADIKKMPHLLVAGSTGSGKSVAIHSILISLLYKNSPNDLRLIMIDPKRVELSVYDNIPHLIAPVVTESKKSLGVFKWAINEMDRRYEILLKAGSRDILSYNKKNPEDALPYVVIVVDEMADLMNTYGREVEGYIVRLAQMARATGLHLILSTQRPSVEVITGLIKANITSRIALQVASQIDSRTILDTSGAEKLLGGGDMLFVSSELSKPKRIQGSYLTEDEIKKVADFIRDNNKNIVGEGEEDVPTFDIANGADNSGNAKDVFDDFLGGADGDDDELLEEAIDVVTQAQKASASLLQRRLKVGYARAARLLDIMEEKGIVGPGEGAKPREVFRQNM